MGVQRLAEHDPVVFSLPDARARLSTVSFHVIAMFGSVIALHPADQEQADVLPDSMAGYISFHYNGGLVALQGTLQRREDLIRFQVAGGATLPRRRSTRVDCVAPVKIHRRDGTTLEGFTVDIGLDGVLIETEPPLEVEEVVLLSIGFPAREAPVDVAARVVRVAERGAGLAFDSIAGDDRRLLSLEIFKRSLAGLRQRLAGTAVDDEMLF